MAKIKNYVSTNHRVVFPLIGDQGASAVSPACRLPSITSTYHAVSDFGSGFPENRRTAALNIGHGVQINLKTMSLYVYIYLAKPPYQIHSSPLSDRSRQLDDSEVIVLVGFGDYSTSHYSHNTRNNIQEDDKVLCHILQLVLIIIPSPRILSFGLCQDQRGSNCTY